MLQEPHIRCCLTLLDVLNKVSEPVSNDQITELVKDTDCDNNSKVSAGIRELVRYGFLFRDKTKYFVKHENFSKVHKFITNIKKCDFDLNKLHSNLPRSEFISRQDINEIYSNFSTRSIDQIILKLSKNGYIEKVGGSKSRGKYYVKSDPDDQISSVNPVKDITKLFGNQIVFCYNTALEIHGLSRYGMSNELYINQKVFQGNKNFWDINIKSVKLPEDNICIDDFTFGDINIKVTNLERTIIDCIHKPDYAIGWENVAYAINKIEKINDANALKYLKKLKLASLNAKVGYIMEQFKDKWDIDTITILELRQMIPRNPIRFFRNTPGDFNIDWNLYVPKEILKHHK